MTRLQAGFSIQSEAEDSQREMEEESLHSLFLPFAEQKSGRVCVVFFYSLSRLQYSTNSIFNSSSCLITLLIFIESGGNVVVDSQYKRLQ